MTTAGLVLDLGTETAGVAVVSEHGTRVVPDPTSRESRWRAAVHWDGQRIGVGAVAEHRRMADPGGFAANVKRGLDDDQPILLGARRFRPVELLAELIAAMRVEAQRQYGPTVLSADSAVTGASSGIFADSAVKSASSGRALVTIPTAWVPGDPRRARVLAAAEAAGFAAVELLAEAVAAACAPWPGPPLRVGDFVLVYDLGATFEATMVRVGADYHEIVGHTGVHDWSGRDPAGLVDATVAGCLEVLARLDLRVEELAAVLPVGAGCRAPGLTAALERGLGAPVRRAEEPELVVLRGAAHWLPRSGARTVAAPVPVQRLVPLSFPIPGGSAQLLRWLVAPRQPYEEGAALARVRVGGGAVWDLTARARGVLDQVLVSDGASVSSGEWLALARH